jgi:hypothetical protein
MPDMQIPGAPEGVCFNDRFAVNITAGGKIIANETASQSS